MGPGFAASAIGFADFPREDSNPHKQIQSLSCYHYTTGDRIAATAVTYQKEALFVKRSDA